MEQKVAEDRILWPRKPTGRPREKVFLAELQSGVLGFPSVIDDIFNICEKVTVERMRRVIHGYEFTRRFSLARSRREAKERVAGLGGSFSFVRVGRPLFGEYRDLGTKLPPYEELAKYIFYTETSRDLARDEINEKTGKIGECKSTSYYLLYTPDGKQDRALDMEWLASLDKAEKNRRIVVYCEKIWVHRDDLAKYEAETKRTVRPMLVPFSLK
jgi:adenine-specific DNA-methyltransferase